jgi:uncharacterized membrane protein YhiD involved in acid resistance
MPDIFTTVFSNTGNVTPLSVLLRLTIALLLGAVVAWIYLRTTKDGEFGGSFPVTITLLCILIAMVTQVIGDSVARAFSLVGALSIVRFRTVVRDTRDTAYVIFAVVVGMAAGAGNLKVALIGILVVGVAAFATAKRTKVAPNPNPLVTIDLRVGLGQDPDTLAASILDAHLEGRKLMAVSTAKQGTSLDFTYEAHLRPDSSAVELVKALNRTEGIQEVEWQLHGFKGD